MEALDGNVLAGSLAEHFGADVTAAHGSCSFCGTSAQVAQLRVYVSGPGSIGRCPGCGSVVLAVVQIRDAVEIHHGSFRFAPESGVPAG